jgi:hypothetical protein
MLRLSFAGIEQSLKNLPSDLKRLQEETKETLWEHSPRAKEQAGNIKYSYIDSEGEEIALSDEEDYKDAVRYQSTKRGRE